MPCPQTDLTATPISINTDPKKGLTAISQNFQGQLIGNIPLMCSDDPETIYSLVSPDGDVLWLYPMINAGPGSITHRVFSWHLNNIVGATVLGLTLENPNAFPLQVTVKREGGIGADGKCIAKALLANGIGQYAMVTVPPHTTAILDQTNWVYSDFFKAEYELIISPAQSPYPSPFNYNLREVLAPVNIGLDTIKTAPVPPTSTHPRGSWPQSEFTTTCVLNIDGSFDATRDHYFNLLNGNPTGQPVQFPAADGVFRDANSVNQVALNNPAAFGAIYRNIALQINNSTTKDYKLMVFLNPRGGAFLGAIQYSALDNGNVHGTPTFNNPNSSIVLETLTVYKGTGVQRIMSLVVGGGSATPVALALRVTP